MTTSMLHETLSIEHSSYDTFDGFFAELADQKLYFVANWVVEQATSKDMLLYTAWFQLYGALLKPYCHFINNFGRILESEKIHATWKFILQCYEELVSYHKIDLDARPLPVMSSKLVDLASSAGYPRSIRKQLSNSLDAVRLVRISFLQYTSEDRFSDHEPNALFPVLESLRHLEAVVFEEMTESAELCVLFANIVEYHILVWKCFVSSKFDNLAVAWYLLEKEIRKLPSRFLSEINSVSEEKLNVKDIPALNFHFQKPDLWVNGGHPLLPSSADIFYKRQQILDFVNAVWPKNGSSKQSLSGDHSFVDTVLSVDTELRRLVMEGACISALVATKSDQNNSKILSDLEVFHQRLLERVESDRRNFKLFCTTKEGKASSVRIASCCSITPEILRRREGLDSWMKTLPLIDLKSINFDIMLLEQLVRITWLDSSSIYQDLSKASNLLQYALNYSLELSSRSPIEFIPHQVLLWIQNAQDSVDSVHMRIAGSVLEMWYNFHSSLWTSCSGLPKGVYKVSYTEPCYLVHLMKSNAVSMIVQQTVCAGDYEMNCLKLRVASRNLWEDSQLPLGLIGSLRSAADSLFKQIIFAHKKHFQADEFAELQSVLSRLSENGLADEDLDNLRSILSSSSHVVLASLWYSHVEPVIKELYSECPPNDSLCNLGCAWLHIGALRFELLLRSYGPDPAMKYAFKHSHALEKISLLKLEMKVRHECEELAGRYSYEDDWAKRIDSLHNLEAEEKKLAAKVLFRPVPSKSQELRSTCADFKELASVSSSLVVDLKSSSILQLAVDRACSWQITSANFIKRLSEEYAEYIDLIQPIQVAVYEMKLGLSVLLSSALERMHLNMVHEENAETVFAAIYSFMEFPIQKADGSVQIDINSGEFETEITQSGVTNMLEKLVSLDSRINSDKAVSCAQSIASINHVSLLHKAYNVCSSLLLDKASFACLQEMFNHFTRLWLDMKSKSKEEETNKDKYYKFKPRLIRIEHVTEGDVSDLSESDQDGKFSCENEEKREQEFIKAVNTDKEKENTEEIWNLIPESILRSVVLIHNQIFGSVDLIEQASRCHITDEQKLECFKESYALSTRIIRDLQNLTCSVLDEKYVPEHLLSLCLEYERTCIPSNKSKPYNIYKDTNAPVMFKMVEPVNLLQDRVKYFLNDWPEHPVLRRIFDITETLLSFSLHSPLSKALLGLQLLVRRVQWLQENDSRFPLKDQLRPICVLVSAWQKLELDSWPALLDGVHEQYNINAERLWFPLRSVLYRPYSSDATEEKLFTVKSIEDFIQTSSIGEFKRRLQLVLAFHGELSRCDSSSSSVSQTLHILYNTFGYYMQFMPRVLEHIETERRAVENDLKDSVKLYRWEQDPECYSLIENFRKTRQKIMKLVQKFNDVLQQPVMMFLSEEVGKVGSKIPAWLASKTPEQINTDEPQFPIDLAKLSEAERFIWYGEWRNKACEALQGLCSGGASSSNLLEKEEIWLKTEWEECWASLEKICRNSAELAYVLKSGTKNRKRRSLADLLKTLEACGLAKHRVLNQEMENQSEQQASSFLQQSYTTLHLLLDEQFHEPSRKDVHALSILSGLSVHESQSNEWKSANRFYFKCLSMMQQLRQSSLKFSKDLSLEQVNRATSFMDHLITVLSEQRFSAYNLFEQLNVLRDRLFLLDISGDDDSLTPNQHVVIKCLWQQKQLIDNLLAMLRDANLLVSCVKDCHFSTCEVVRKESASVSALFEKFIPIFTKAKELLDNCLVGYNGVISSKVKQLPIVTRKMEQVVEANWQTIVSFREDIESLDIQRRLMRSAMQVLISRFEESINKGKVIMEDFHIQVEQNNQHRPDRDLLNKLEISNAQTFEEATKLILNIFGKLDEFAKVTSGNITLWKDILQALHTNLKMDQICNIIDKAVVTTRKLVENFKENKSSAFSYMESRVKHLYSLLRVLFTYAEGVLYEFLDAHKTTCETTLALGQVFILLFSEGFGSAEEQAEGDASAGTQDATGTGMGEGEGIKDVSEQIEDESQILGCNEKQDGMDELGQAPSGKEKGIEMDEDFAGETFSVSEDSDNGDESGDDEEVNLESQMGDAGDNKSAVGEKSWDDDGGDENAPDKETEKYESGPSIKETDHDSRELRAKDDNALGIDESDEMEKNGPGEEMEEDEGKGNGEEEKEMEGMEMDKKDAFEDPTGAQLQEEEKGLEDAGMDEGDLMDGIEQETGEESDGGEGEEQNPTDGIEEENVIPDGDENGDLEGAERDTSEGTNIEPSKENIESDKTENIESVAQPSLDPNGIDANMEPDANWANSSEANAAFAPSIGRERNEAAKLEISLPDSTHGSRLSEPNPQSVPNDTSENMQMKQTNPFRSIGDAMEEWKERAKVVSDERKMEMANDENTGGDNMETDEYVYVEEGQKSTSQALGAATVDQMKNDFEGSKPTEDENRVGKREQADETKSTESSKPVPHIRACQSMMHREIDSGEPELVDRTVDMDVSTEEMEEGDTNDQSSDLVLFRRNFTDEKVVSVDHDSVMDEVPGMEETTDEDSQRAVVEWKRHELSTTRLSQELAEQLRLVMEPTLASKLQGDYRTGKRINMKKVIPYIASHFRKDKIWLRRTKPNKRNYQVVVAVDDSLSMSESQRGKVAIEALVTVCRAMSQLEVGQLAVASYGKRGNIRLLHDFDQTFTSEAGVKMISSFSFKQDNTLGHEPVVDLLKYLNNMLDTAVARSRTPSGQNPLEQLILIIADGQLSEKENLRRCVRDALHRKRMIAYIILDSPQQSIMELPEVAWVEGKLSCTKYMNTFPFPYYIVLKNIEALPRTLADLMRQWFELMQGLNE